MRKTSEVLLLAVNHPNYLNFDVPVPNRWLCSCIGDLGSIGSITKEEAEAAYAAVYASLGDHIFLRAYLIRTRQISEDTKYQSQDYSDAAYAHWAKVIAELEAKDQ